MRRRRAALSAAVFILIIALEEAAYFGYSLCDVDFWLDTSSYYQKVNDQWVTRNFHSKYTAPDTLLPINCKNHGALPATFEITITFNGTSFSSDTSMPYLQINSTQPNLPLL